MLPSNRRHRTSSYPAFPWPAPPASAAERMWRASYPFRPARPHERGSMAESDITIVPSPPRYRYPAEYRTPPMHSFPRYPVHPDIREWDEYDEDYDVPSVRTEHQRQRARRHSRVVPPTPPMERDERDARSTRRSSGYGSDKVDFQKACTRLKKLLQTAIKQFKKLDQEFQEETKAIEKYASKRILDDLWKRKIGADQGLEDEDEDDEDDLVQEMHTYASKARFMQHKVEVWLRKIINAGDDERKDESERQQEMVVKTKIEAAERCITGIWPNINESRKQCSRLLTELSQLYEVLRAAYPEGTKEAPADGFDQLNVQEDNGGTQWG